MKTVIIQIGNTDDKLPQAGWSNYVDAVRFEIGFFQVEIHFIGFSPADAHWQNACFVVNSSDEQLDLLKKGVTRIRKAFKQDSVAWTEGKTEFV